MNSEEWEENKMNNLEEIIVLLEKETFSNFDKKIEKLERLLEQLKDPMNYTKSLLEELNKILIPTEALSREELDRVCNFSILSDSSKEYYLKNCISDDDEVLYSIVDRINNSIKNYAASRETEINIKKLIRKLKGKSKELINKEEIDFINKYLRENNILGKDIWKAIHEINYNIFKSYNIDVDELHLGSMEETNVDENALVELLNKYNIDFSKFSENDRKMLLSYADLRKIEEILQFLEKECVLTEKLKKYTNILTLTFIKSSLESLKKLKSATNGIDFREIIETFPTALYPSSRTRLKRNKSRESGEFQFQESGLLTTIQKNIELMRENNISIEQIWEDCPSFLKQSHMAIKDNISGLKSYGISLLDENNKPRKLLSVLGYRNPSMIDIYDLALEADAKEYALKNLSSLSPATRYKFCMIKAARKHGMLDSDIFRGYKTPNKQLALSTSKLLQNPFISDDIEKQCIFYGNAHIGIPNSVLYDNLFDIINPINISSDTFNDENIRILEKFKESEDVYNFNGVRISRRKVLRRYSVLKDNNKDSGIDALLYCIVYGSMLDENELKNIYDLIRKICKFDDTQKLDIYSENYVDGSKETDKKMI